MKSVRSADDPGQNLTRTKAPRRGRVERLLDIIRTLDRERKIEQRVALELAGVDSESSFKRIKRELKRAGFPLTYHKSDKCYHIPPEASLSRYGIDARTRTQLAQVRAAVAGIGGVARDALQDVLEVLEARIAFDDPEAVAVVTSRLPQPRGGPEFFANLDRALSAVREHHWLSFDYEPTMGGQQTRRTIAPYAVHSHDGRYYVWGTMEGDASDFPAARLFALDRMDGVEIEDDTFEPDATLDLEDALRQSFGTMVSGEPAQEVTIEFSPEVAAFVGCRTWPAETGRLTGSDGSLRLSFEVTKIDELVAWVLSFGGAAVIVAPESAVAEVVSRADKIIRAERGVVGFI